MRASIAISAAVCVLGVAPATASGPTRLTMQSVSGENIHLAGKGGAINRHTDIRIEVELGAAGRLKATAVGTDSDHNLYETFSTTEESKWTNAWSGSWSLGGGALSLSLSLDSRTCTRTKAMTGAPTKTLPCPQVSKLVRFSCTTEQVRLEELVAPPGPAAGSGATAGAAVRKVTTHEAWRCTADSSGALGETPASWLLGKATCLRIVGGHGPLSYQRCVP